ncbi:hypothetical protein M5K25_010943 [Dendrobium thyrsiflorum]|uniref:Uncharacterized protein n=1 Tax=Dendrobium thyrsiflorum TaxID=117978 RepID=A0ABD0V8F8_DENTH
MAKWFVGQDHQHLFCLPENQVRLQTSMKKELERLRENHLKIQAVVFAANQEQISDQYHYGLRGYNQVTCEIKYL